MTVKELTVFAENEPGQLARIGSVLGENDINIRGVSISDGSDYGVLRLLVDKPDEARQILARRRIIVRENDVIVAQVPDEVGALGQIAKCLGDAGVNIEYIYTVTGKIGRSALIAMRIKCVDEAVKVLKEAGYKLVKQERL